MTITNSSGDRGSPCLSPLFGLIMSVGDPSTSTKIEEVVTHDITISMKFSSIPSNSIAKSIASHLRVSKAFEKSIVTHARLDVLLQLKDYVNSCARPIAVVILLALINDVWF